MGSLHNSSFKKKPTCRCFASGYVKDTWWRIIKTFPQKYPHPNVIITSGIRETTWNSTYFHNLTANYHPCLPWKKLSRHFWKLKKKKATTILSEIILPQSTTVTYKLDYSKSLEETWLVSSNIPLPFTSNTMVPYSREIIQFDEINNNEHYGLFYVWALLRWRYSMSLLPTYR